MNSAAPKLERCAIYCRFSEDDLQKQRSIGDQEQMCREYAARMQWDVVQVYKDEGVRAGAWKKRLGWNQLMHDARQKAFDVVLVEALNRMTRETEGTSAISELRGYGVLIAETQRGLRDIADIHEKFTLMVDAYAAEKECVDKGLHARRGLRGQVQRKYHPGGAAPFGLKRLAEMDPHDPARRLGVLLEPDAATAAIVLRIFREYADGHSKHSIAVRLNADQVPSPRGGPWGRNTISNILANRIYQGVRVYGRTRRTGSKNADGRRKQQPNALADELVVSGNVKPIVDDDTWKRVEARLREDRERYNGPASPRGRGRRAYLLSGLLQCGGCGRAFAIKSHKQTTRFYKCTGRTYHGSEFCKNEAAVNQAWIEERVRYVVDTLAKDPIALAELVRQSNDRVDGHNRQVSADLRGLHKEKVAAEDARDKLLASIEAGGAPASIVERIRRREAELAAIDVRIERARARVQPKLAVRVAREDLVSGDRSFFSGDLVQDHEFLKTVVDGIEIDRTGDVTLRFKRAGLFAPIVDYEFSIDETSAWDATAITSLGDEAGVSTKGPRGSVRQSRAEHQKMRERILGQDREVQHWVCDSWSSYRYPPGKAVTVGGGGRRGRGGSHFFGKQGLPETSASVPGENGAGVLIGEGGDLETSANVPTGI